MAKSRQTFGKKNREQEKQKHKRDKEERREERKANSNKGKGMDSMMAYVNEFGQLSSTPPDPARKKAAFKTEDIQVSIPRMEKVENATGARTGKLSFFNTDKGYGFIKEDGTQESIFVHINEMAEEFAENDKLTFEVEMGAKGPVAVRVKRAV